MESQEQTHLETPTGEQPELTDDIEIDLNGEKIPLKELKSGYMRHSDYTRKTQEVAEERKKMQVQPTQQQDTNPDLAEFETYLDQTLQKRGYVKAETLDKREKQLQSEMALQEMMKDSPEMKPYEKAIKDLMKDTGKHPADIVEEYFAGIDKVAKARSTRSDIMGTTNRGNGSQKDFKTMNPEEKRKWYLENREKIKTSGNGLSKADNAI